MGGQTKIEWVRNADGSPGVTWNPVTGCSRVSPGCEHCYAERLSHRFGWTSLPWTGPNAEQNVVLHEDRLEEPLRWRKPRTVFVCSMADLFHEQVPDEYIDEVLAVMALTPQHTYQVLTKRPERMRRYLTTFNGYQPTAQIPWPLPNVWLGVSAEDQRRADDRIPLLLEIPAAVRFVSCEPLLGPIRLRDEWLPRWELLDERISYTPDKGCDPAPCAEHRSIDWLIVGGESGPRARPMHPDWVRSIRDQCRAARVRFFFKQWGEWLPNAQEYGANPGGFDYEKRHVLVGNVSMCRAGKKAAGRLLDGRTWDEMPRREEAS